MVKKRAMFLIGSVLLGILLLFRVWNLSLSGLYDYDSVRNREIICDISNGEFSEIFHHASPSHFVFSAWLPLLSEHFLWLICLNAVLNFTGFTILLFWLKKRLSWTFAKTFAVGSFAGSCLFWIYESGCIAAENMSLPFFIIFLILYEKSFSSGCQNRTYWLRSVFVFAFVFTVNYKILTFLPAVLLAEIAFNRKRVQKIGLQTIVLGILTFAGVLIFWSLVGLALGLEFWRYAAYLFTILTRGGNPEGLYFLQSDFLFHFKYFFYFESPLLLPGLLLFLFFFIRKGKELPFTCRLLGVLTLSFTAYMQLTFKVPRALSFAYLPLYFLAFEGFRIFLKSISKRQAKQFKPLITFLIMVSFVIQVYRTETELFRYRQTNYDQMAGIIKKEGITAFASTIGNGIQPFLSSGVKFKVLMNPEKIRDLNSEGFNFLLYDSYADLIDKNFELPEGSRIIAELREPSLLSLFLYLEQNDMSGLGFDKALELREEMKARKTHLILYELKTDTQN